MTLAQLLTLADQHRRATSSADSQQPAQSGPGLIAMAAM
jgi:hypothetical protein